MPQASMQTHRLFRAIAALLILLTVLPASGAADAARSAPRRSPAATRPAGSGGPVIEVGAEAFGRLLADDETARIYPKPSVFLQAGDRIRFTVQIPADGPYSLSFDMAAAEAFVNAPEGELLVDGAYPSPEARRIVFPIYFQDSTSQFPLDRYGNEALIRPKRLIRWSTAAFRDASFSQPYPVQLSLTAGEHTFDFGLVKEKMWLGSLYLEASSGYPDYARYQAAQPGADSSGVLITLEAEHPAYKNDTVIRPISTRSLEVTPYDTYRLLLNTLGGESWQRSGSAVYYEFDVPADGQYLITLRALQNTKNNFTVFRRITLDRAVRFDELNAVPFSSSARWANITLGGAEPYRFFLGQGRHVLGLEATNAPYLRAITTIRQALIDINALALEIKKLTGNQVDVYKEWAISDYIPDLRDRLLLIADDLSADLDVLTTLSGGGGSQEALTYQMAIDNIRFLADDPDKVPIHLKRFSEGSGSAAQLLGSVLPSLQNQPLTLDKLYIHSPDVVPPQADVLAGVALVDGIKRFLHSFAPDPYQSIGAAEGELEVWVNRPRQYVDLLQTLTDQNFTPRTGIRVKFSIMPQESKLILANAAGIQPDVALGVSTNVPYELAVRNALQDLRAFPDFSRTIRVFSPGALLSYIINDSVYALPETQDFWVTYYRKDILDSLGIPVPTTWPEVIQILPELQRRGLNYNTPLSGGAGTRGYLVTAPYLFNHGAQLYSPDGFSSGLGSDQAIAAMQFMAESFTLYGMPLETASFYDSFRYGSLPVGVSNFETYIKLVTAAPEIDGLWGIGLYPATVLPDGRQLRYATGSAQASIIFAATRQPEASWEFMKWWVSTETQVDFQQQLILSYGREYLWNSANLEAFRSSSIAEEHKAVILEQWEWLQEPVKLPGSYMQEREISNAWNRIVFDGWNARWATDSAIITINREIARKMEEFGYLRGGQKVRTFKIPTLDTVRQWQAEGN